MKSIEIRQKFFDYFQKQNHTKVSSSSLIPAEDPTLLFANAGMNQFKDCFLGKEKRSYTRAVTIQKCIRAGGKHNDLDNVGRTKRHLTFFEMMGNFSFGDYFKQDAIRFAWEFLTIDMGLPAERLYISIYKNDDEAFDIWHKEIGIPQERIVRLGEADNFWQMGDTGPCGPCTEIHYDKGAQTPEEEHLKVGDEGERFLEIWNLVFMQFDRQTDGTDVPLAKPGVDTGMGLERLASVLQGVDSSFDTDLFAGIMKGIEKLSGKSYKKGDSETRTAFRVLADHIRSTSLAIADGGTPSNEGRGYVLRKIIRRAALFANKLGSYMIFPRLVDTFVDEMGGIYPELVTNKEMITSLLTSEVEKFAHNLERGQIVLEKYLQESAQNKIITGKQAFTLYDTYGFPPELTNIMAFEKGYTVDEAGFEEEMEQQRLQSGKKVAVTEGEIALPDDIITEFTGYNEITTNSKVIALVTGNKQVKNVTPQTECWVITEKSPFYVECGGQVSDQGTIEINDVKKPVKEVKKIGNGIALRIDAPQNITVGDPVKLAVDAEARANTVKNHTATHLLQAALVRVLGPQVKQAGSLVTPEYLRFDFTHHQNISEHELRTIEQIVNAEIMRNTSVSVKHMTYKAAIDSGIRAFFGEKYNPDDVRAVEVNTFSRELCGGVHVHATGEIGCFKITSNVALSAGVRRITAVTGPESVTLFQSDFEAIKKLSQEFKVQHNEVLAAITKQKDELKQTQTTVKHLKQELFKLQVPQLIESIESVNGIPFGYIELQNVDGSELRDLANLLVAKKPGLYFLVSSTNGSAVFFAIWAPEFEKQINPNNFANWLRDHGFKGGGKKGTIQGGCQAIDKNLKDTLINFLQKN